MFARYAIAIGRGAHRHALLAGSRSLARMQCIETPELAMVAPEGTPFLTDGRSILVGQIFSASSQRLEALPHAIDECIDASSLGQSLQGYWGNYVLFSALGDRALCYREPSGNVPVNRCGPHDQTCFVSDAEFAINLGLLPAPAVDLRFAAHWLQFPFLRSSRTGLENVAELLPGMLQSRHGAGPWEETSAWHPSKFVARSFAGPDMQQAAALLRDTALSVIPAQARSSQIILRLSGGLDSSIIAACLAEAKLDFSAINFVTRSADGDERAFAREVASRCGVKLEEIPEPDGGLLEPETAPLFRPGINPLLAPFEQAARGAAEKLDASLLMDGGGGDNLFCSVSTAAPVLDALQGAGLREAGTAIRDIAGRAGCTHWDVFAAAARRAGKKRRTWKEDRSFLQPDCAVPCELHPWLDRLDAPPGKREHVEALVHIQHFLDRGAPPLALLHPLMAQPLLELCLGIPSWWWMRGGRDRAVARAAFEGIVPSAILTRRAKGSLQSMFHRSFGRLRSEMLDLLMSGELRASGIVNPASVEAALAGDGWQNDEIQLRISEMVALELWLGSWRRSRHSTGP